MRKKQKQWQTLFSWASKSQWTMTAAMKLKDINPWKRSYDKLSILKSRDVALPTKVCIVKAMVFPAVMYGCESWTIKKPDCRRIDAFELCCWRLLTIPWTARRSNQSIPKEINSEYSLEGLMLKLKLQYISHSLRRYNSLKKTKPDAGKDWRQKKRAAEDETIVWYHQINGLEFEHTLGDSGR